MEKHQKGSDGRRLFRAGGTAPLRADAEDALRPVPIPPEVEAALATIPDAARRVQDAYIRLTQEASRQAQQK